MRFPHSRPDRCQQRPCNDDIHGSRQIVCEHAERHLARDLRQCLHQEVRRAHPHLERSERVLDHLAALAHGSAVGTSLGLRIAEEVMACPANGRA